ncbi:ABC transporter G family member 14 [Nephila pilipes]|uniref:ABC transporter G family member 14 n=1 Tax=Nephila pilipes TaxID=299642 RepID=A0A8X6N074_NEPPI|nr:ABC transporter G family member 14 [Nephila pilipes]
MPEGPVMLYRKDSSGFGGTSLSQGVPENGLRPLELVFRGIKMSCKQKTILHDVFGMAKPGEMLAVMGPSGSGKTTLLNALSGRAKVDSGVITLSGELLNKELRRRICYVLQQDIFMPNLTLRQTLKFCALLRLPSSMSTKAKMEYVDHLAGVLDLRHCLDTHLTALVWLTLSPELIHLAEYSEMTPFVMKSASIQEPTTGLDSSSAYSLMMMLKQYAAEESKTVVVTVHQPSSQIFHMFDRILLLCKGQVAYFGKEKNIIDFFTNIGLPIEPHYNPADFIMEQLKKGCEIQEKIISAAQELRCTADYPSELKDNTVTDLVTPSFESQYRAIECPHCQMTMWQRMHARHHDNDPSTEEKLLWSVAKDPVISPPVELRVMVDDGHKITTVCSKKGDSVEDEDSGRSSWWSDTGHSSIYDSREDHLYGPKWPASFWTQLRVLSQRNFIEGRRRMLSKLNWAQTFGLGIVSGLMWFQIERKEETIFDVKGWMFFSSTYWMLFALFEALVSFPPEREVINKERASGAYRLSAYYCAKMLGELPLMITLPTVFHIISYPLLGFTASYTFLALWGFLLLSTIVAQSVGLFVGAACHDLQMSVTISSLYSLSTMLFGGYYASTIPPWLSWLRYLSMVHYTFQAMQIVEFSGGSPVICAAENTLYVACRQENATFIPPDDIINKGGEPLPLWANTLVLFLFLLVFRLLGYLSLRFCRTAK